MNLKTPGMNRNTTSSTRSIVTGTMIWLHPRSKYTSVVPNWIVFYHIFVNFTFIFFLGCWLFQRSGLCVLVKAWQKEASSVCISKNNKNFVLFICHFLHYYIFVIFFKGIGSIVNMARAVTIIVHTEPEKFVRKKTGNKPGGFHHKYHQMFWKLYIMLIHNVHNVNSGMWYLIFKNNLQSFLFLRDNTHQSREKWEEAKRQTRWISP